MLNMMMNCGFANANNLRLHSIMIPTISRLFIDMDREAMCSCLVQTAFKYLPPIVNVR